MFRVTKGEAEYIREHAKNVRITTTGKRKNSRQKKWYVDESREAIRLLKDYNNSLGRTSYMPK